MKRLRDFVIAERVVVAMIVLNTIALSISAHLDNRPPEAPHNLDALFAQSAWLGIAWIVDYFCVAYFLVEAVLKINVHGWKGYWNNGWNRFDFTVVLLSLPVLIRPIYDVPDTGIILTLRLGRLFRLFRMMRFIPNREHLYAGVKRALKASVGVFLAMLLLNLILALGATQLFKRLAPEYFSNPLISSYSVFKIFTIEGWYEIPDFIAQRALEQGNTTMAVVARVYFIMSVTVGGLLGLALANAVFVDEMMVDNNDNLEDKVDKLTEELREMRKLLEDKQD